MSIRRSILPALVALAASGCSEGTGLVAPDPLFGIVGGPNRVAGSGHVQQAAGLREFTFHAVAGEGGGADGSFKVVLPNGLFVESDVTCLSVAGNTGWVGGTIRATNAGNVVVGSRSWFFAIDGSEGAGTTDLVSLVVFNGADGGELAFCENQPVALPTLTVTDGNVQVH